MIVAGFLAIDPSLVGRREAFVPLGRFLAHCGEVARTRAGEQAGGRDELHEVAGEGEERADGDLAAQRQPAAEHERGDHAQRRDGLQHKAQ